MEIPTEGSMGTLTAKSGKGYYRQPGRYGDKAAGPLSG